VRFQCVAAIVLGLAIQQTQPPSGQRFRSSVDLVQVDVIAVDGEGRPIRDLAAEDFELRVDGRPRQIVAVQFVSVTEQPDAAPDHPADYSSNARAGGGRLIMIAVDRTSLTTGRAKPALEAASRFVRSLNSADRVALATIPEGPQVTFTADRDLVANLLMKIQGTAVASFGTRNIGVADALAFERRDDSAKQRVFERECGIPNTGSNVRSGSSDVMICQGEVQSEALVVASDARARARQSVTGLQRLLDSFPPSQTPKILAYISEGLVVEGEPSPLSWLDAKAAAAHVTIYPLHLETTQVDASLSRPPANPLADRTMQEHGLSMLAQATGGDLFRVMSTSDFPFERLRAELSGYYLLGFEPRQNERDGQAHDISVRVRRRGVTVRSRRQFRIPIVVAKSADTEVAALLRDPLPAVEIPLKLTTYTFRAPREQKMRLFIAAEIDRSINAEGRFTAGYVVVDFDGKLVTSQMDSELPPAADRQVQRYFSQASVEPGKYTVKLAVVDDGGRRGSIERVAEARLTQAGAFRATDLLIGEGPDRGWGLPLAPSVTGEIAGGSLHGHLELFGDRPEVFEGAGVTLEIVAAGASAPVRRAPMQLTPSQDDARCRIASVRVDVTELPPGEYIARAVISTGLDASGQVSRPFRIVRSAEKR
jgi:VWFA-related protein